MKRRIEAPANLIRLASLFLPKAPLYIVGGFVRNSLLGIKTGDIDIAAPLPPEEVRTLLANTPYRVRLINARLGTLLISSEGYNYEYTAFRHDSYLMGEHRPRSVQFTEDIRTDASRRDFTVNSLYYDINSGEILDFNGGLDDLKAGILRAADDPARVFSEDGLRIMRFSRFAAELNFQPEQATFNAAKDNVSLLLDIVPERITVELIKLLKADACYGISPEGHYKGLKLLEQLGALKLLFGGISEISLYAVLYAAQKVRLAAMFSGMEPEEARKAVSKLKFSAYDSALTLKLNKLVNEDYKNDQGTLRELILDNPDIISEYILMLEALDKAGGGTGAQAEIISNLLERAKSKRLAIRVTELEVNGSDLIKLGVSEKERARILRKLLSIAFDKGLTTREAQLSALKEIY